MKKIITKEVKIGITGIVALCVLVYGINWLKGIHMFKPSSYLYAKFENVNGLTESSAVFADGVRVGLVRSISYDYQKPGNVLVQVELNNNLRIPKGSTAELVSELMGGVRMNLLLAHNEQEQYEVGDTIRGKLNNGMMDQAAQLIPQVEKMLPKLDSIMSSLNTILADQSIPNTLHNMEAVTGNLAEVSGQLKGFMNEDVPQLMGKVNTIGDNFITISNNLKEIDYAATLAQVDETLANVKALTDKLNSNNNTLGLLFNDSALYNNLNSTAANAASLLEDLRLHPKRYVHFSLFGRKEK